MNHIGLIGRMTREPCLRKTPSGACVLNFTLAVERRQGGERSVDFIDCIAWNQTAEFIAQRFGKGTRMGVEGNLHSYQREDKTGERKKIMEVVTKRVYFADSPRNTIAPTQAMAIDNPLCR